MFEGEKSSLSFTIRNVGQVDINYIFIRIQENVLPSEESSVYESEVYQRSVRAFYPLQDCKFPEKLDYTTGAIKQMTFIGDLMPVKLDAVLEPGNHLTINLGVFGKRRCNGGIVQLSYGNVESIESFFTRELTIPFILTVVQALSFKNPDLIQYIGPKSNTAGSPSLLAVSERSLSVEEIMMNPRLATTVNGAEDNASNTFLFTFDVHNEWDEPFRMTFDVFNGKFDLLTANRSIKLTAYFIFFYSDTCWRYKADYFTSQSVSPSNLGYSATYTNSYWKTVCFIEEFKNNSRRIESCFILV